MGNHRAILIFFVTLIYLTASAGPARPGRITLTQPDGKSFQAFIRGDEWTKIKTTADGHAIMQDQDGWWCYAVYDGNGEKTCTGSKVGDDTPSDIIAASMRIPYEILSESASLKRRMAREMEKEPAIRRILRQKSPGTRASDGNETVTKHGLVILAAFNDVKFKHTADEFNALLTQENYSVNGATGSAKEYFDAQFDNQVKFDFQVSSIVTLPRSRSFYGGNDNSGDDKAPAEMIRDACRLADKEIDFSLYDDDGDGYVDNVFVFFAGADEAEGADEECIWSHAWYIRSGAGIDLTLDGKTIDRYACSSELSLYYDFRGNVTDLISGIGTFCHEYSHTFGLPDFYDTDYETNGGMSAGLWGSTSLMDGGNYNNNGNTPPYFNAIERMIMGIAEPVTLSQSGAYVMEPVHKGGKIYLMETDTDGEFFLLECRSKEGWDKYIGGSGMLAYHIDMTPSSEEIWYYNEINNTPDHQCVDLLEADGRTDGFTTIEGYQAMTGNIAGIFFPYGSTNSLTADSSPGLTFWNGGRSSYAVTAIRKDGDSIRFSFVGNDDTRTPPTAVNITREVFADAAIIRFESSYEYDSEAQVTWGRLGQEKTVVSVAPYSTGKYAIVLEGLEHSGKTYEADIVFIADGLESETRNVSFITKRMPSVDWPYIYLKTASRQSDGSFAKGARIPLLVYGDSGAVKTSWSFDGKTISHDGDGYFTIPATGILQATVYWEDGSTDRIIRKIILSE